MKLWLSLSLLYLEWVLVWAATDKTTSSIKNAYIIEFETPTEAHHKPHSLMRRRHSLYNDLATQNISHHIRQEFQFINAISIAFDTEKDAHQFMKHTKGIKRKWPVRSVATPNVGFASSTQDKLPSSLFGFYNETGVNRVRQEFNLLGKGIKVGIIDTGIDYTHPALGGCYGPGCRVAFGHDFVGDSYTGDNDAAPDNDPIDTCNGHGTHVAGIVGANDLDKNFTGIAPEVTFGAYRIFGCSGSSADDIIMKAMEKAYLDGMDVINMSLGDNGWPGSPSSMLADKLSLLGMAVCAAAGNEGEKGIFEVGAPSLGRHAISIASVDNSMILAHSIQLGDSHYGYTTTSGKSFDIGDSYIVPISSTFLPDNDGCNPVDMDLTGKVALIARGGCIFAIKVEHAQKAGAVGVLIYNNNFGFLTPSAQSPNVTIPCGGLSQEDGKSIFNNAMDQHPKKKYTFLKNDMGFTTPTSGLISSFSSWGLGPDLSVKPDITAPGGLIYSTYPMKLGGYATLSGTSMASPFVAGIVALLHESRGSGRSFKSDELRTRLINNAHPVSPLDMDVPESVARQGGGLVDIYQAIKSTTSLAPEHLRLNDDPHGSPDHQYTFTITNKDRMEAEYSISHLASASVEGFEQNAVSHIITPLSKPRLIPSHEADAKVTIPAPVIKLRPNDSANVTVQIVPPPVNPAFPTPSIYSGYMVIKKEGVATETLYLPYAGMTSSLSSLPVLLMNESMPFVFGDQIQRASNAPVLITFQLAQASELVMVTVVDAKNATKSYGWIPGGSSSFVGRSDLKNPTDVYTLPWYGTVVTVRELAVSDLGSSSSFLYGDKSFRPYAFAAAIGDTEAMKKAVPTGDALPPGAYRLQVMALRAFGDEHVLDHYDRWTSPVIIVD